MINNKVLLIIIKFHDFIIRFLIIYFKHNLTMPNYLFILITIILNISSQILNFVIAALTHCTYFLIEFIINSFQILILKCSFLQQKCSNRFK